MNDLLGGGMAGTAYALEDVMCMASGFDSLEPHSEEDSSLVALGAELSTYLRVAPGRTRASVSKVALGVAVLDVWTGHSTSGHKSRLARNSDHLDAASLIAVGAATAMIQPARGEAGEASSLARMRVEQAISSNELWKELWSAARKLGEQTGFSLEVDASRAARVWRALFAFATDRAPLRFPATPDTVAQLLRTVIARSAATDPATLSTIKASWPVLHFEELGAGGLSERRPVYELEPIDRVQSPDDEGGCVPVWFGTNRVPNSNSDVTSGYRNTLDRNALYYGRCLVKVSSTEEVKGGPGRFISAWLRPGQVRGSRFQVDSYFRFANEAAFQRELDSELARMAADARSVLVFIHGYNTSFRAAAETAAYLSVKIKHPGATAMFSWASHGSLLKYQADERTVDVSRKNLGAFLQTLASAVDFEHIDIVVHSLGNRLFLRTLIDYFQNGKPPAWRLRNLFLGAPDIDQAEYVRDADIYQQAATTATMYGSTADSALLASSVMHRGSPRAGLMPPVAWTNAVHAIETSAVNSSRLGHNVLLDVPTLHADAKQILDGEVDPDRRANLMRAGSPAQPYWRF